MSDVSKEWGPSEYANALERAAQRVEQGWCQGVYGDGHGGVCLEGAVALECGRTIDGSDGSYLEPDGWHVVDGKNIRIVEATREHKALSYLTMSRPGLWNDEPGRAQKEVVEALQSAARRARADFVKWPVKGES